MLEEYPGRKEEDTCENLEKWMADERGEKQQQQKMEVCLSHKSHKRHFFFTTARKFALRDSYLFFWDPCVHNN